MYAKDMAKVRKHGLKSPDGLVDVITFVLLTIQQPLGTVERQFADVAKHGAASIYLFGAKRGGYTYAVTNKARLYAGVAAAVKARDVVGAVDLLADVPGLGMVKAAFVAQLLGMEVACLDRHNLTKLGLGLESFKLPKGLKPDTRRAKIAHYIDVCTRTGGSAHWWNSWCAHVATNKRSGRWASAAAVSAYHWQAMGIAA